MIHGVSSRAGDPRPPNGPLSLSLSVRGPLAAVGPPSCTTRWSGQWGPAWPGGHTQVLHGLGSPTQSCGVRGEERPLNMNLAQTSN